MDKVNSITTYFSLRASISFSQGFTLLEILVSMLVVAGSLTLMFSGFDAAGRLDSFAEFESEASFLAEREIELLKSELINGQKKPISSFFRSRFKLKPGWSMNCVTVMADLEKVVRLICSVAHRDRNYRLESFIYVPEVVAKS